MQAGPSKAWRPARHQTSGSCLHVTATGTLPVTGSMPGTLSVRVLCLNQAKAAVAASANSQKPAHARWNQKITLTTFALCIVRERVCARVCVRVLLQNCLCHSRQEVSFLKTVGDHP